MGGHGSGRPMKIENLTKLKNNNLTPGNSIILPNYSGLKEGLGKSETKDVNFQTNQELLLQSTLASDDGELLKLKFMNTTNPEAKAIIAFMDENEDTKAWLVAHQYLSYPTNNHSHFSIELSDSTGALQSRLTFPYDEDICEAAFNQCNLTLNRNDGETNGNLTFGGIGGGGKMQHANSFSFYPEYATNSTYAFKIGLEGASNDQVTLSAIGSSTLYIDDGVSISGALSSGNITSSGTISSGSITSSGTLTAADMTLSGYQYMLDDMATAGKNISLAALGVVTNVMRGKTPYAIEYWDGGAWVAWSGSTINNLTNGNPSDYLTVDATHKKFRVTYSSMSWNREFAWSWTKIYTSWGYSGDVSILLETSTDGSTFTTIRDYGNVTDNGYQYVFFGVGETKNEYRRWTFDFAGLSGSDTVLMAELAMYSYDPSNNPHPIQASGTSNATCTGNFDIGGTASCDNTFYIDGDTATNATLRIAAPDNYDQIIEFYNSGTSTSCGAITYDESAVDLIIENKITGSNSDIIFKTGTTAEVLRCKGSGSIIISGIKSGATQAGAGAAAGEVWKTASHATLPDNVLMIGV